MLITALVYCDIIKTSPKHECTCHYIAYTPSIVFKVISRQSHDFITWQQYEHVVLRLAQFTTIRWCRIRELCPRVLGGTLAVRHGRHYTYVSRMLYVMSPLYVVLPGESPSQDTWPNLLTNVTNNLTVSLAYQINDVWREGTWRRKTRAAM